MNPKTQAREVALKLLYQDEFSNNIPNEQQLKKYRQFYELNDRTWEYATYLYKGIHENTKAINQLLESKSNNWSLERMNSIDRNILRIATFEMIHSHVPVAVAVNEAIELAKRFGTENSSAFVNGVLDSIIKNLSS